MTTEKTTTIKKKAKKVAVKKPKLSEKEKAERKAAKKEQAARARKAAAENKKLHAKRVQQQKLFDELGEDFNKLCKKHKIKGTMVFANDKLEVTADVASEGLMAYEGKGLITLSRYLRM